MNVVGVMDSIYYTEQYVVGTYSMHGPVRPERVFYNVKLSRSPEKLHHELEGIFQALSLQDNGIYHGHLSRNGESRAAGVPFLKEQDVRVSWTGQLSLDGAVFRYVARDDVLSLGEVPDNSSYEQDDGSPSFYRIFGKHLLLQKKNETIPPEHFMELGPCLKQAGYIKFVRVRNKLTTCYSKTEPDFE